jgi:hypothetical protein
MIGALSVALPAVALVLGIEGLGSARASGPSDSFTHLTTTLPDKWRRMTAHRGHRYTDERVDDWRYDAYGPCDRRAVLPSNSRYRAERPIHADSAKHPIRNRSGRLAIDYYQDAGDEASFAM